MFETYYCKACACKLWSDYSKQQGLCSECEEPDSDSPMDLEDRLRFVLEKES